MRRETDATDIATKLQDVGHASLCPTYGYDSPSSRAKRGDLLTTEYLPGDCFATARNDEWYRGEQRQRRGNLLLRRTPFTRAVAGCDCRGRSATEGRSRSGPQDAASDRPRKAGPAAEESAWGASFLRRVFSTRKKCDSRLVGAVRKNTCLDEAQNRYHLPCHEAAGCWARFALPNLRLRRSRHRERSVAISRRRSITPGDCFAGARYDANVQQSCLAHPLGP